jgi:transposase
LPSSGHQTPQEEEIRHVQRENDLLRQERDILKKARRASFRAANGEISVHG